MSGAWVLRAGCRLAVHAAAAVQCKEDCHRGNTILEHCHTLSGYRARCERSHCAGAILPEAEDGGCWGGQCYMMGKATTGIHAEEYRVEWGIHLS